MTDTEGPGDGMINAGDIKWIDYQWFWESGLLAELNRVRFYPRGMAMAINCDHTEIGIIDALDDDEGVYFPWKPENEQGANAMRRTMAGMELAGELFHARANPRTLMWGQPIQPVPTAEDFTQSEGDV